jgi:inosose dehydratase
VLPLSCHQVAWPRLRPAIAAAGRLGFTAVEAFAVALARNHLDDVSAWLAGAGIGLSAVYTDLPADPRVAAGEAAWAAAASALLGCRRLVVAVAAPEPGRTVEPVDVCAAAAEAAAAVAPDVRLCLHPHAGTAVESRADIDRVMAATDPDRVWVCPDTGHLLTAGDDPAAAITAWASRVAAIHLKDVDRAGRVVPIGAGRLALDPTLAALDTVAAAGRCEHLTLEVENVADPDGAFTQSLRALGGRA